MTTTKLKWEQSCHKTAPTYTLGLILMSGIIFFEKHHKILKICYATYLLFPMIGLCLMLKEMIICAIDYPRQAMFIKFVGTHKEYDRVNAGEVE